MLGAMLGLWAALSLAGQEPLRPNLDGFKYPALPRSARIQGTVEFTVKSDGIHVESGQPMLVAAAKSNLEKWAVPYASDMPLSVTYNFRLADPKYIEVDEPIGGRFDRFFRRLFGLPVTRRVKEQVCLGVKDSPGVYRYKNEMNDGVERIEIDIEADSPCLMMSMLLSCAALTMTAQETIQPNLDGLRYPVLAKSARIQGIVQYVVKSDGIQQVSGNPLLAVAAKSNLEKWAMPHANGTPLAVTYVFRLTIPDDIAIEVVEPIGDQFDRFFLRLLHLPVTRRVKKYRCTESRESAPIFKSETKDGLPSVEVTVEAQPTTCLQSAGVAIAALWR